MLSYLLLVKDLHLRPGNGFGACPSFLSLACASCSARESFGPELAPSDGGAGGATRR